MKSFIKLLGGCVLVSALFGVGMLAASVVLFGGEWNDECTAPEILHGEFDASGWSDLKNGDEIDSSRIHCDSTYHLLAESNFSCSCKDDGEACGAIKAACSNDLCTRPSVKHASFEDEESDWEARANGTSINGTKIVCDDGWTRTSTIVFVCNCGTHDSACAELTGACTEDNPDGDSIYGDDDGDDDGSDGALSSSTGDSSSGIPLWLLVLLVVGDAFALVLLALACYLCYDYHSKKQAEAYWDKWNAQKHETVQEVHLAPMGISSKSLAYPKPPSMGDVIGDAPMAIPVMEGTVIGARGGYRGSAKGAKGLHQAPSGGPMALLEAGGADARLAVDMDKAGKVNEAISLYQGAIQKLTAAVEGLPSTDRTFAAAVKIDKYRARIDVLLQRR